MIDDDRISIVKKLDLLRNEVLAPRDAWEQAEKDRVEKHQANIRAIKSLHDERTPYQESLEIKNRIIELESFEVDASFEEYEQEAKLAKLETLERLRAALVDREKFEAESAELERLRKAEQERLQREHEERIAHEAAEKARLEAERKAKEEADRVEREKQEAIAKAEREKREASEREARLVAEKKRLNYVHNMLPKQNVNVLKLNKLRSLKQNAKQKKRAKLTKLTVKKSVMKHLKVYWL